MPGIKILKTETNRLEKNIEYRMIIRKNGISFRKANSDDPLDTLLILSLTIEQLLNIQLIEKNKGKDTYISLEADIPEDYHKTSKTIIEFKSTELPDKILYKKILILINPEALSSTDIANAEKNTTTEDLQDQEIERDPLLVFFDSLTAAFLTPIAKISAAGIALLKSSILGVQNTIKTGLKTINRIANPLKPTLLAETPKALPGEQLRVILQEEYLDVNKVRLYVVDSQLTPNMDQLNITTNNTNTDTQIQPKQKVLVFLHGFLLDWTIWQPYINYFASGYRVISFDLRGHGKSPKHEKTKQHKYKDYFDDFDEFFKAKNLYNGNIELTIIAFSTTGMIFLHYLENKTFINLKNLILLSSADFLNNNLAKAARNIPSPIVWQPLKNKAREKATEYLFTSKESPITEEFISLALIMNADVLTEVIRTIGDKRFEKKMNHKKIAGIHLLAIGGDSDNIYPPAAIQELQDIPNAELKIMENAKHMFPFERPAEVIEQIKMFLNKSEPKRLNQ